MQPRSWRAGFSIIEIGVVIILIGIMVLTAIPKVDRSVESVTVDRAAGLIALTLERSFTLASRQRKPVTVACEGSTVSCPTMILEVRDCVVTGQLCLRRSLGGSSEFALDSLTLSEPTVKVMPFGVAQISTAPFTITLVKGDARRRVTMSSAGMVRVERG